MSEKFDFETLPAIKVIPFDELKVRVHEELKLKGIYAICVRGTSQTDGMVYIGSTSRSFRDRLGSHRSDLAKGKHHAHILQRIYSAYGQDAFVVRLIEPILSINGESPFERRKRFLEREQFWLDSVPRKCLLNSTPTAGSQLGRIKSDQEIEKTRIGLKEFYANNPEARAEMRERTTALWQDIEHQEYMRQAITKSWQDESVRQSRVLGIRKTASTSESKEKRRLASIKVMTSGEVRGKVSQASLSNWRRKEYRQIISAARRLAWQDPEHRALQSASRKACWQNDPQRREAQGNRSKEMWKDAQYRESIVNSMKLRMSSPEARQEKSDMTKALWADDEHRAKRCESLLVGITSKSDPLIFMSPDGLTYVTDNATVFAEKFGLIQTCMSSVARGTHKKHKGWTGWTCESWQDIPCYAIRVLTGDHPDLLPYQKLSVTEQEKINEENKQKRNLRLQQSSEQSLDLRLKTLGSKSLPIIYMSPNGEIYVSDVPSQFASTMGFTVEGQRHKFSLIIRNGKSYKGWTGYKLASWVEVPNNAIRVLWGDHPDLPKQVQVNQKNTHIQLSFNL